MKVIGVCTDDGECVGSPELRSAARSQQSPSPLPVEIDLTDPDSFSDNMSEDLAPFSDDVPLPPAPSCLFWPLSRCVLQCCSIPSTCHASPTWSRVFPISDLLDSSTVASSFRMHCCRQRIHYVCLARLVHSCSPLSPSVVPTFAGAKCLVGSVVTRLLIWHSVLALLSFNFTWACCRGISCGCPSPTVSEAATSKKRARTQRYHNWRVQTSDQSR